MLQIALCDDEELHLRQIESLVQKELEGTTVRVTAFPDAATLLCSVQECGYAPDIAILDIQMENMDGIELAHRINAELPHCRIIFLTGFLNYISDVYETEHVYYILKSEMEERLGAALTKALAPAVVPEYVIRYRDHAATLVVPVSAVTYLERHLKKTLIFAGEELWTTQTPQELLSKLPKGMFIQCHQSYWVRCSTVKALEKSDFVLADGTRIPISRTYQKSAKEAFFKTLRVK